MRITPLYFGMEKELLQAILHSPGTKWLSFFDGIATEQDVKEWIEHSLYYASVHQSYDFAIVDDTGRIVGSCGLFNITSSKNAEIYVWRSYDAGHKGIAAQAVSKCMVFARDMGISRVEANVAVSNKPAIRFFSQLGVQEGIREGFLQPTCGDSGCQDAVLYRMRM